MGSTTSINYNNGSTYRGKTFLHCTPHGNGTLTNSDGSTLTGYWDWGRIIDGQGTKYIGEFQNGCYEGEGTFENPNGTYLSGEWKKGIFTGNGTHVYNGSKYTGDLVNDKRHGHGEYIYSDGSVYIGEFVDNKRQGLGEFHINGKIYKGNFKQDKYHGLFKIKYMDNSVEEGHINNGVRYGKFTTCDDQNRLIRERFYDRGYCKYDIHYVYHDDGTMTKVDAKKYGSSFNTNVTFN